MVNKRAYGKRQCPEWKICPEAKQEEKMTSPNEYFG
jgi:hypothetical protein